MSIQFLSGGSTVWIGIGSGVIVAQFGAGGEDLPYLPLNSVICFDTEGGLPAGAADYTSNYYAFEYSSKWPELTGTAGEDEWLLDDPLDAACFSTDMKLDSGAQGGARVSIDTAVNGVWSDGAMIVSSEPGYLEQPLNRFEDDAYGPVASHIEVRYYPSGVASWSGSDTFSDASVVIEVFDPTTELAAGTNLWQSWYVYLHNPGVWAYDTMDSVEPAVRLLDSLKEGQGFAQYSWWNDTWQTRFTAVDSMESYTESHIAWTGGTGWATGWTVTDGDIGAYEDETLLAGVTGAAVSTDHLYGLGQSDLFSTPGYMDARSATPAREGFVFSAEVLRGTLVDGVFSLNTYSVIGYTDNVLEINTTGAGPLPTTGAASPANYVPFSSTLELAFWPYPTDTVGQVSRDRFEDYDLESDAGPEELSAGVFLLQYWSLYAGIGVRSLDSFSDHTLAAITYDMPYTGFGWDSTVANNPHPAAAHWSITPGMNLFTQVDNFDLYAVAASVTGLGSGDPTWEDCWSIYDPDDTWTGETSITGGAVDAGADWGIPTLVPSGSGYQDRALFKEGTIEFADNQLVLTNALMQGSVEDVSDTEVTEAITNGNASKTASRIPLDESSVAIYAEATIDLYGWTV